MHAPLISNECQKITIIIRASILHHYRLSTHNIVVITR